MDKEEVVEEDGMCNKVGGRDVASTGTLVEAGEVVQGR